MKKMFFIVCGCVSLGLGFVGVFLPLLPTTPFVLLASACFARGSTRLHIWLRRRPRFGRIIIDWEHHRVIRPRAKWAATGLIAVLMVYPLCFSELPPWLRITLAAVVTGVLVFIWTRRSRIDTPDGAATPV